MKLLATGLCARATRIARLGAVASIRTSPNLVKNPRTYSSTQSAVQSEDLPYPEQSVPLAQEVDPRKTARAGKERAAKRLDLPDAQTSQNQSSESTSTATETGPQENTITLDGRPYTLDETSNLSSAVTALIGRRLYEQPNHPICITRKLIESVFPSPRYANHVAYNPVATTEQNFDILGFPQDHPGRSRTDTYYVNSKNVLRTHTSAHQHQAFQHLNNKIFNGYTVCADVYRRDSIDKSHFPVFHQMEGALCWKLKHDRDRRLYTKEIHKRRLVAIAEDYRALPKTSVELVDNMGQHASFNLETNAPQMIHTQEEVRTMVTHLKRSLEHLVSVVFDEAKKAGLGDDAFKDGDRLKVRWVEAYFPFTSPSFELEIFWQGEWLELLGCGIVQQTILDKAGLTESIAWAWGIGVERLAMLLFGVPDIRLFWSEDSRFLSQFKEGQITKFVPFSKYPACYKDVAFWIDASPAAASPLGAQTDSIAAAAGGDATKASPADTQPGAFHENDVMEIVRDIAGSLAEDVEIVDEFVHPTSGRKSLCYRLNYRSLERTLTNEEVNEMHQRIVQRIGAELRVELR